MSDEQIDNRFIGHEKEIQFFENWLDDTNPDTAWILFLHDKLIAPEEKGGVGKTWLLRKFATIAEQREGVAVVMVDFFNVADRNAEIARRVAESMQKVYPDWHPDAFNKAFEEYRAANREDQNMNEPLARLYDTLTTDLDALEERLSTDKKRLIVFFDTFELIEQYPVVATLNPQQSFPDTYDFKNIGVVIAGRNAPDWHLANWRGRERQVKDIPIAPFTLDEMVDFINENRSFSQMLQADSREAEELYVLTKGRPILVGLVTDVLNYRIITLDKLLLTAPLNFEEYIVSKINELENPINWVILFMAHAYHRFNQDILFWLFEQQHLVEDINIDKLWKKVQNLSFVRRAQSGENITLHDEMRRLVNKYNWRVQEQGGLYRRELSSGMIKYYDQLIEAEPSSRARQTYTVEQLYHRLFVNWDTGFEFFQRTFSKAISRRQNAYARSLLQEVRSFDHTPSTEQAHTLRLNEADLLRREESYQRALQQYRDLELLADTEWFAAHEGQIIYGISNCQLEMSRLNEAMTSFQRVLKIYTELNDQSRVGVILARLGFIHRRLGELDKAAEYYESSMAIHKSLGHRGSYAAALNDRSNVYRLQGKYEEALRKSTIALQIRQREFAKAGSGISEIGVGQSLGLIGHIYLKIGDLPQAQKFFEDAFEIYTKNRYKKGTAIISNRFGQLAVEKSEFDDAMRWFQQGYRASQGIDAESEINSLNKQGTIYVLRGDITSAVPLFEQARRRASEIPDFYQQVESLIDLADAFEKLGQIEQAEQMLQEAEEIAKPYKYDFLLGRIESIRAERAYLANNYLVSFQHFGQYCYNMARFNPVEYEKAVRRTTEQLLKITGEEFTSRWEQLYTFWQALNLKEDYSHMLYALEDIKDTMVE
jgi:tetratricopeptide (TPR) repeat protein